MIGVPQKLFLAGATGQLGSRLIAELMRLGQRCVVLTRRPERIPAAWDKALDQHGEKFIEVVVGDPLVPGDWQKHLETATGVVNLCGENIFAKRWSPSFKELLRTSRLISTSNIRQSLVKAKNPCPVVNASGIGFYGGVGAEDVDESSIGGDDFLATLCMDWEREIFGPTLPGQRQIALRIGMVLDPKAGALAKMLPLFRWGLGGALGWGPNFTNWIHHADLTGLILHALFCAKVDGPINAVAPNPLSNLKFAQTLGKVMRRPALCSVPLPVIRLALGEVATGLTAHHRIKPRVALETGYSFQFEHLQPALEDLLG